MRKWPKIIKTLLAILFVSGVSTSGVYAAVAYPQLDIQNGTVSSVEGTLTIDASVIGVIIAEGGENIPFDPLVDFFLEANLASGTGSLIAGNIASPLLTATFSNFDLFNWGDGIGEFSADLNYTGGSMKGGLAGGTILGSFNNASDGDFSESISFGTDNVIAKIGPVSVVPVPAAVWLFGSGLIGLVSMARKRVG